MQGPARGRPVAMVPIERGCLLPLAEFDSAAPAPARSRQHDILDYVIAPSNRDLAVLLLTIEILVESDRPTQNIDLGRPFFLSKLFQYVVHLVIKLNCQFRHDS